MATDLDRQNVGSLSTRFHTLPTHSRPELSLENRERKKNEKVEDKALQGIHEGIYIETSKDKIGKKAD